MPALVDAEEKVPRAGLHIGVEFCVTKQLEGIELPSLLKAPVVVISPAKMLSVKHDDGSQITQEQVDNMWTGWVAAALKNNEAEIKTKLDGCYARVDKPDKKNKKPCSTWGVVTFKGEITWMPEFQAMPMSHAIVSICETGAILVWATFLFNYSCEKQITMTL